MNPDEIIQLLNILTPAEREDVMKELNITDADLFSMGGGMSPMSEFDFGEDFPEFGQGTEDLFALGNANYPSFTASGEYDPRDLSQIISSYGLVGNQSTRLVDNASLAMMGSDLGMYDPAAFQPTVTAPTERLRSPGQENLSYLQTSGSPYERYVAEMMATRGMSAAQAVQQMLSTVNEPNDPSLSDEERQQIQDLKDSLSQFTLESKAAVSGYPYPKGGADKDESTIEYDIQSLTSLARDWEKMLREDPLEGEGWVDELGEFGPPGTRWTEAPVVEPSAQAEWYMSKGLPLPTEQYTDPKFMEGLVLAASPTYPQEQAAYDQNLAGAQRATTAASISHGNRENDLWELLEAMEGGRLGEPNIPWPSLVSLTGESGLTGEADPTIRRPWGVWAWVGRSPRRRHSTRCHSTS